MLMDAAGKVGGIFGGGQDGIGTVNKFESLGGRPQVPMYGAQPSWSQFGQPDMVTSDVHSKTAIKQLTAENQALKAALAPPEKPTKADLDQAFADQMYARKAAFSAYPDDLDEAKGPTKAELDQAFEDQERGKQAQAAGYPADLYSALPPTQAALNQAAADQDASRAPRVANRVYRSSNITSDENEKTHSAALDMV